MYRGRDMANEVSNWAREIENIRVVILTSTRTNPNASVDALSDYDIELFVRDLDPFLEGDEWLAAFGDVMAREPYRPFLNETVVWRLVLFRDAPRIDFAIQLVEELEKEVNAPTLDASYDIGYDVLVDKDGMAKGLKPPTYTAYRTAPPTESEYEELVHTFWFNITYVAKGLYRDEVFFAKQMLDGLLHHHYLKTALAWYIGMQNNWKTNPGAFGRWFKKQLDPQIWSDVEATFAGVDFEENWKAMFRIAEIFGRLTSEVGANLGYTYPIEVDRDVTEFLNDVRHMDNK